MDEPVSVDLHESTGDSPGVDVPAIEDSLALPPLPPPTPTEVSTSTEALMTVEDPFEGQGQDPATELEATDLPQAGWHAGDLTIRRDPPDLRNALNFRASNRAPTFLRDARLVIGGSFPRHPPPPTDLPYGLAGIHHFVSDRGRLYWSDEGHNLSGNFGTIYTATLERPPSVVTVKISSNSEAWLLPRRREEYIYRNLDNRHPDREHILSFYGSFNFPDRRGPFAIVLGKCNITLAGVLQAHYNRVTWCPSWREKLPECFTKLAITGILMGLRYLAEKSIVHRSLRPEHVIISLDEPRWSMLTAKLADFSYASNLSLTTPDYQTPLAYTPPDVVFAGTSFNHSSDVWCAGCILAHMLIGHQLVSATAKENYLVSFRPCMRWEVWFTERIYSNQPRPESWPKLTPATVAFMYENDSRHDRSASALLRSLLQFRPLSRASAADALGMRYVRFGSFEEMYSRMWLMGLF